MQTSTRILGATTIALAISCAWLAHRLQVERHRTPAVPSLRIASVPVGNSVPENPSAPVAGGAGDETSSVRTAGENESPQPKARSPDDVSRRERWLDQRRQVLARPEGRGALRVQAYGWSRRSHPELGTALGLSQAEEKAVFEVIASAEIELEAWTLSRKPDESSDTSTLVERENEQIRALLGSERYERFTTYLQTLPERQEVIDLRSRLNATHALSAEQSQQLMDLMYQERKRYTEQHMALGAGGYAGQYPFTAFGKLGEVDARFAEEQIQRTEDFLRGIRERSAAVISAEQLGRLAEIHEEYLARERSNLAMARMREARDGVRVSSAP